MALIDYSMASNDWDARNFKEGDVLDASFHYTAKFPYFYIVTRNTGKTVFARKLGRKIVSSDMYGQMGTMIPDENTQSDKIYSGRILKGNYLKLDGNTAHKWDGQPVSFYGD